MVDSKNPIEYYRSFELVGGFHQGRFQGHAYHPITKKKICIVGSDITSTMEDLKRAVDLDVAENWPVYRKRLDEKHRIFLASIAAPSLGRAVVSHSSRANHCYDCKKPLDNTFDLECIACRWTVCNYCGACACG